MPGIYICGLSAFRVFVLHILSFVLVHIVQSLCCCPVIQSQKGNMSCVASFKSSVVGKMSCSVKVGSSVLLQTEKCFQEMKKINLMINK